MRLGKIDAPVRVYFYQRKDGSIFSCNAHEAGGIHGKYKYIGTSDGTTFFRMLTEEQERQTALLAKTAPSRVKKLEQKLLDDTVRMFATAQAAEMEEAKKDQTPPPSNQMHVSGQTNSFVDKTLSRILNQ